TCLHDDSDDRVPAGNEEGGAAGPEGGQRAHLRARRPARCRSAPIARRDPELLWWPNAADDGAARRTGEGDARRHRGNRKSDQRPEAEMTTAIVNHLWQSTLFAFAATIVALALRRNLASTRHTVWLAASMKFLLPFSLLMSLGAAFAWRQPAAPPVAPVF